MGQGWNRGWRNKQIEEDETFLNTKIKQYIKISTFLFPSLYGKTEVICYSDLLLKDYLG